MYCSCALPRWCWALLLVLGYPESKRNTWSTYFKVVKDVEDESDDVDV